MTHIIKIVLPLFGLVLALGLSACARQTPTPAPRQTFPRVSLPSSEVRQLHSEATGREYDLYIRLPGDYDKFPLVKYPVLYLLDGQWDFKMLDSIYGGLEYDNFVPEMIIVGITYTGDNPDYNTLRAMDMSPVKDSTIPGSGDAPKFLAFLKDQVIPFVETNYQVNPSKRVLMGSSFGGLFALYTLFTEPTLFTGYVASSPYVVYANWQIFDYEEAYAGKSTKLPARLYLTVGGAEDLKIPVQRFMDVLQKRAYEGLSLETRIIEDAGHSSNKPESYNRGLRYAFQD